MKVAIGVWQGKVAGVFDFARELLVVEFENGSEKGREQLSFSEHSGLEKVVSLKQNGVNVLICGAISRPLAYMLGGSGIRVLPFVTGAVEQVLAAYKQGRLSLPQYALFGCWQGARAGFRRHRRRYGPRQW